MGYSGKTIEPELFLPTSGAYRAVRRFKDEPVFLQGQSIDAFYYLREGRVKLSVLSGEGKRATVALASPGEFLGEECLIPEQLSYVANAIAISECNLWRFEKIEVERLLREQPALSKTVMTHLLTRNLRLQEDLLDQIFNSCEKRLARTLLRLVDPAKRGSVEIEIPRVSQQTLAEMVGTTRQRVNYFMNKFREAGLISYHAELSGDLKLNVPSLEYLLREG